LTCKGLLHKLFYTPFHDINLAKDMKEDIRSAEQDTKSNMQEKK
jgi:hypothetical protein